MGLPLRERREGTEQHRLDGEARSTTSSSRPSDDVTTRTRRIEQLWKHKELFLLVVDLLLTSGGFLLVRYLGLYEFPGLQTHAVGKGEEGIYLQCSAVLAGLWVGWNRHYGGYERGLRGLSSPIVRAGSILRSGIYAIGLLIVVASLFHHPLLSPLSWFLTLVLSAGSMLLVRLILRRVDRALSRRGITCKRVVVVGTDRESRDFAVHLRAHSSTVRVVGFILEDSCKSHPQFLNCPILGSLDDIARIYRTFPFDAMVLPPTSIPEASGSNRNGLLGILNFCETNRITLYVAPGSYDVTVRREEVASFSDVPLIRLRDASLHPLYAFVKRCTDVVFSGVGLIVGLPVWTVIAITVKLTSKGPVFFTQTRVGIHGKPFKMYKFRSMVCDAEAKLNELVDLEKLDEPVFKIEKDPRVTRFGVLLRRFSLDEIPQLWHVFMGKMALVGPRPEEDRVVAHYDAHQRRRLKAKPGLTGLQQVECRGDHSLSRRIAYDLIYMKHQGLLLDLYIVFKTFVVVLRGSGTTH